MNAPDDVDQSAAMTSAGNGGAGRVELDCETVTENECEDEMSSKKMSKWNGCSQFTLLQRWVTGERTEMDINRAMYELAHNWMPESRLWKLPVNNSKATYLALWKQFREYTKERGAVLVLLFRCPMRYRCGKARDKCNLVDESDELQQPCQEAVPQLLQVQNLLNEPVPKLDGREIRLKAEHSISINPILPRRSSAVTEAYIRHDRGVPRSFQRSGRESLIILICLRKMFPEPKWILFWPFWRIF